MKNNVPFYYNDKYWMHVPDKLEAIVIISNLGDFFEEIDYHKNNIGCIPLANHEVIKVGKREFRTERIFKQTYGELKVGCLRGKFPAKEDYLVLPKLLHCYIFIDITLEGERSKTFVKTPSYVNQAINDKKITITNTIYPTWK